MAQDHPDYLSFEGRSVEGGSTTSYSFSGSITSGSTGTVDLTVVATNEENTYQAVIISCNDDTAIHRITLSRVSDGYVWFIANFVTGGLFDIPGETFGAGTTIRVSVTNNSASTLTFEGSVNWTTREIT